MTTSNKSSLLGLLVVPLLAVTLGLAAPQGEEEGKADETLTVVVPFYGNPNCPFMGKPVKPDAYIEHEGQKAYFCCSRCKAKAEADPAAVVARAYAEMETIENEFCPVGKHETSSEKAVEVTFQGHRLTLCCSGCEGKFEKSPNLFLTMALHPDAEVLNAETCPASANAVDADTHVIIGDKIVRLCCPKCVKAAQADPAATLEKASS